MKDADFIQAFERARLAFKPATRSDGSEVNLGEECRELVDYLLSDRPLTKGHRLFLAKFFAGEAFRERGGQAKGTGDEIKQAVGRHYIARRSQGWLKKIIYSEIQERFGIKSKQTVINYLNDIGRKSWAEERFCSEIVQAGLDDIERWRKSPSD